MTTLQRLLLPTSIRMELIAHAQAEAPNECVGLLAGTSDGAVLARYPLVNALAHPMRFESEPRSLLAAERRRRAEGLALLAVYHSHPATPAVPSSIDTNPEVNFWIGSDILSVIVSLAGGAPQVRAYRLLPHQFKEVELLENVVAET